MAPRMNLEVFKFGMYLAFPIGIMFYFGTNLESRFAVPEFWPTAKHSHKIPFERDDIKSEYARLAMRNRRYEETKREREGAQPAGGQQEQEQGEQ